MTPNCDAYAYLIWPNKHSCHISHNNIFLPLGCLPLSHQGSMTRHNNYSTFLCHSRRLSQYWDQRWGTLNYPKVITIIWHPITSFSNEASIKFIAKKIGEWKWSLQLLWFNFFFISSERDIYIDTLERKVN